MAYDAVDHTIILYRKTRNGTITKYIRTLQDLESVKWFTENVWNAKFKWDPNALNADGTRGRIVQLE